MSGPFCTNGPVPPDSPVYVQREADHQLRQHLLAKDCVLLTAPSQMGKTSLIHRLRAQLTGSDHAIVYVDLQNLRGSAAKWYHSLCSRLSVQPDIKTPRMGKELRNLLQSIAEQAEESSRHIVIALDGIGNIPETLPAGFLQTLQGFLIARKTEPRLRHLTFILSGESAAVGTALMTPLTLKDFYRPQVRQLVDFLEVKGDLAGAITDRIYHWTGGHPYLTQKMCSILAEGDLPLTIEGADQAAERIREEDAVHLPYILKKLDAAPRAKEQLTRIMAGERMRFNPASELALIGVVKSNEHGNCVVRNKIYEEVLKENL